MDVQLSLIDMDFRGLGNAAPDVTALRARHPELRAVWDYLEDAVAAREGLKTDVAEAKADTQRAVSIMADARDHLMRGIPDIDMVTKWLDQGVHQHG
tara:strand:- start:46 stop:336 length:291 start_codon:yes stop_codon:yes gene_type:complete